MNNVMEFDYYQGSTKTAHVRADFDNGVVEFENFIDEPVYLPFGVRDNVDIDYFNKFLERRCFPRSRMNCSELLSRMGLSEYIPAEIVRRTHGYMIDDHCWMLFKGETLTYEKDIKLI